MSASWFSCIVGKMGKFQSVVSALLAIGFAGACGGATLDIEEEPSAIGLGAACKTAGALGCNGSGQKLQLLCDGAHWVQNGVCPGSTVCDARPGPTVGSCQEPDPQCLAHGAGHSFCDGAVRKTCAADLVTTTAVTCESAARCAASTGSSCGACAAGEHRCQGDTLQACSAGAWADKQVCPAGTCVADAGACAPKICKPGEFRCNVSTLEVCAAGGTEWDTKAKCGGDCNATDGRCDPCTEGAADCFGEYPRTCSSSGIWVVGDRCELGCSAGVCTGTSPCVDGTYQCDADILQYCSGGTWASSATCAPGTCNAATKSCGGSGGDPCTVVGARDCVSDVPRVCDSTLHWSKLPACSGTTPYCSGGTCVAPPTTVTFPSMTSTVWNGTTMGTLGSFGNVARKGSYVEESFPKSTAVSALSVNFTMADYVTCPAMKLDFTVTLNGTMVGTYSWTTGSTTYPSIYQSWTFSPIVPTGTATLRYQLATEIPTGCGGVYWGNGGSAKM